MLTLQIKEKEIENLTPEEEFIRGTVGAKCQINFDEFWQSYNKYIVFKRVGYEPINFMVDTLENEIEIPYTILAESGEFKIGVFGTTETETLPTLYSKDIKILYGTDTHGTTPPTYIPSEIDQLRLSKQDKLVSGENIKTVNGESVLGSGNIKIQVEVDQTYSPTSENAQSGKAVAEAIDQRTVYQKFIDDNKLKQRNWVDLSFVGGEYYYTDFLQAVADVNADTTVNSTTDSTNAVCQIFKNDKITVLRLLSDLSVTTPIIFAKSIIFDINGFTISLSENGVFGKDEIQEKLTIVYYGAKINSTISATNVYSSILLNSQYTYILGGIYVSLQNDDISFQDKYARYIILSETDGIFDCVFEVANCDIKIESTSQIQEAVGIHINRGADAADKINCLISNSKIVASNINSETVTTNKISAFALWFDDRATQTKNLINVKCENSTIKGLSIKSGDYTADSMGAYCACHCLFENCNLIGIHSGISLGQNVCYLKNCICASPGHGGIYANSGATIYIDDCEFYHRMVNGVTPWNSSAAYFANGSVSYINNSSFIIESGVSTPEGIAIKGQDRFPATKVYLSNCYLPNIRCDSGHYIYLGEGINKTIQNVTVNGTKILTTENYSSDNDNKTIVDIEYKPTSRSPQSGIAVANAIANEIGNINDILATVVNGGVS